MKANLSRSFTQIQTVQITAAIAAALLATMLLTQPVKSAEFSGTLKSVQIVDAGSSNLAPNAVIEYSKGANNVYTFSAAQSSDPDGSISEYRWDFGDGSFAQGVTATHQYVGDPTPVTLTVVDNLGGVALGQVSIGSFTEPFEIIVDDADPNFSITGTWTSSSNLPGYYGKGYHFAPKESGKHKATWNFDLPTTGTYQVYIQYATNEWRATDALFTVHAGDKFVGEKIVNQRINGGAFFSIGSYQLDKGALSVSVLSTASGFVCADAVKLVYVP